MRTFYKKNKLQQLKGFCTVMEEGSILKASKKMNIAQSSVSLQISTLERDLDISLFKRENQRLIPTLEAHRFYRVCKKSVDDIYFLFNHTAKLMKQDNDNIIKLAGHSYMLSHILPFYFEKILEKSPDTRFEISNLSYEEAVDKLNNGIFDMALYPVSHTKDFENILVKEFYKCEFSIAMAKKHPLVKVKEKDITWDKLTEYDYITIGNRITTQGLQENLQINGISSKFNLQNGSWEICMGMIKRGLSIGGADVEYFKWHNDLIVKKCPHLIPEYKFHIMVNKKIDISKASSEFLKVLDINF